MDKFTTEETAIIFKRFEEQRICPLQKDSDKYCAAVLSIVRKLAELTDYGETNISRVDASGAVSTEPEMDIDKAADLRSGETRAQ